MRELKLYIYICAAVVAFVATACQSYDEPYCTTSEEEEEVSLCVGSGALGSRMTIGGDGWDKVLWESGDEIFVWAKSVEDGDYTFSEQPFVVADVTDGYATFTSTMTPMPEGDYDYFAVYPKPLSVEGEQMHFEIAATQNGDYSSSNNIISTPKARGSALTEQINEVEAMRFTHHTHMLRLEVPEGRNLLGERIKQLTIAFPADVVGGVLLDYSGAELAVDYAVTGDVITIDFDGGYDAGEGFVWVAVAPGEQNGRIEFSAVSENFNYSNKIGVDINRTFAAGSITPITLTIPEVDESVYTYFSVEVGESYLGEQVHTMYLVAPEGTTFDGINSTITIDLANELPTLRLLTASLEGALKDKGITVYYESQSAYVKAAAIPCNDIVALADDNNFVRDVPHLFAEDFSTISENWGYNDGLGTDTYSVPGLEGWIVTNRVQAWAATSIALKPYYFPGFGVYLSRATSPFLSGIKEGETVNLKVEFNADWKKSKLTSANLQVGLADGVTLDDAMQQTQSESLTSENSASQTNIPSFWQINFNEVGCEDKIAWTFSGGGSGWHPGYCSIYIDNIKISIVE